MKQEKYTCIDTMYHMFIHMSRYNVSHVLHVC